jgi:hypothetical protein
MISPFMCFAWDAEDHGTVMFSCKAERIHPNQEPFDSDLVLGDAMFPLEPWRPCGDPGRPTFVGIPTVIVDLINDNKKLDKLFQQAGNSSVPQPALEAGIRLLLGKFAESVPSELSGDINDVLDALFKGGDGALSAPSLGRLSAAQAALLLSWTFRDEYVGPLFRPVLEAIVERAETVGRSGGTPALVVDAARDHLSEAMGRVSLQESAP